MELDFESKLEAYSDAYSKIREQLGGDSVGAAALIEQLSKDARLQQILAERKSNGVSSVDNGDSQSATPKQISYLKSLGVKVPNGITKKDASDMLDKMTGK